MPFDESLCHSVLPLEKSVSLPVPSDYLKKEAEEGKRPRAKHIWVDFELAALMVVDVAVRALRSSSNEWY